MPKLKMLLEKLIEEKVEFVLIGGYASTFYGVTLVTRDMDVCCRFSVENLMRLQAALADLHPVHRTPTRPPLSLTPEGCRSFKNLYLSTDYGPLGCLGFVEGVGDYDAAEKESITLDLAVGPCRVLNIDALIRAKEAAGRPLDKVAVIQLKAIRERLQQGRGR